MRLKDSIPIWLRAPRSSVWLLLAVVLLAFMALLSPAQLPIALYKAALIALAAVLGYWLDRCLFPYARPDGYLSRDWRYGTDEPEGDVDYHVESSHMRAFCTAQIRRAIVVAAVVLGVALGL